MRLSIEALDDLVLLINNRSPEKDKRILPSAAAKAYGHGGEKRTKDLAGAAFSTLHRGKNDAQKEMDKSHTEEEAAEDHSFQSKEGRAFAEEENKPAKHTGSKLKDPAKAMDGRERQRKTGAGRPSALDAYPDLPQHIEALVNWRAPAFGSPLGGPIRIDKAMSERKTAEGLMLNRNENASSVALRCLLPQLGYSKTVNQKEKQAGEESPWRDNQFLHIAQASQKFMEAEDPIISIDAKKKEKVGEFKNNGREWRLQGLPREVLGHDFMTKEPGQASPYGVCVANNNTGFINLGVDHDTSEFAAESIRRWWDTLGKNTFPNARQIHINCDGGGNGSSRRAWKVELQRFADKTGLTVAVSHCPPGTGKWNKTGHGMFSHISRNWEGKPLVSVESIINLIESMTAKAGLAIKCRLDTNKYELGSIITDGMPERVKPMPRPTADDEDPACPKQLAVWNYTIQPRNEKEQAMAAKLDEEEITAEKTRVKRKYNKKPKESN